MSINYSLLCNNGQAAGSFFDQLSTADKSRYGVAGAYRCYGSLVSWLSARGAVTSGLDVEYLEVADSFIELAADIIFDWTTLPSFKVIVTATIKGIRTAAYHNGVIGDGYILESSTWYSKLIHIKRSGVLFDGITFRTSTKSNVTLVGMYYAEIDNEIRNCIFYSVDINLAGVVGLYISGDLEIIHNNLAYNLSIVGFDVGGYGNKGTRFYNNTAINCGTGIQGDANIRPASFYNNISFGCTIANWADTPPAYSAEGAGYNAGEAGDVPFDDGQGTSVTTLTSASFADYANNDFRPATITSPQVDSGITVFEGQSSDIKGVFRPNYSAGAASDEWDIGCFEFDSGNGLEPQPITILIKIIDSDAGLPVQNALVYIDDDNISPRIMDEVTDAIGEASIQYNDVNVSGATLRVRKYGYKPYRTSIDIGSDNITSTITLITAPQQI